MSESRGLLKEDNHPLNAKFTPLSGIRNSDTLKLIRKTLLEGNWPDACIRCKTEERSNLRSRRIYENESWQKDFSETDAKSVTEDDGTIREDHTPILFLDLRFGNKCNLKCRMCGPTDSDLWYQDQGELWGGSFKDTHGTVQLEKNKNGVWKDPLGTYDWYSENDKFWSDLEIHAKTVKKINIVGGEPLLIDQHYLFLEKMVKSDFSKKVELEYNTNLTILPQKALELWSQFKNVRIGVSLDGFGTNNSYIRHPSKWDLIVKNLKRLDQADGPFERWISATIQSLNAFEITDLIQWKVNESGLLNFNKSKRLPILTTHALHRPEFLSLKSLPQKTKQDVSDHYFQFIESTREMNWSEPLRDHLSKLLNGYMQFMNSADLSSSFNRFMTYTSSLDRIRGESLEVGAPKLYRSLKSNGYLDIEAGNVLTC